MNHPIKTIETWIVRLDFGDPEKNLSSRYIHVIALFVITSSLILGLVYAMNGQDFYLLTIALNMLVYSGVIMLLRYRFLQTASSLFLVSGLVLLSLGIYSAGGIHASSSVIYPVILVFASLLLNRKNFILYGLLCLISIGFIIYAENQGINPVRYTPDPPSFSLFITYALVIATAGVIIRSITESLQNNTRKVQQYAQELSTQKAMLDRVGQAVVACQLDNTVVYWNQAAASLYGWETENALGRKYFDIVPTRLNPDEIEEIRGYLQKGESWTGEMSIQRRDESPLTIIGTVSPLYDQNDAVTGWIGVATDITERHKIEQLASRRMEEMILLNRLGVSVVSGKDLYSTLFALQSEIIKLIRADAFYVAIYDENTDIVKYPIFFDEGSPMDAGQRCLHERPGLTGAVILNKKTLYLPDMFDPVIIREYDPVDDNILPLHTFLGIPLISNKRTIGMLSVQSREVDAYAPDQIQLMENIAVQAAIAIDKANLMDQLKQELLERKKLIDGLKSKNDELDQFTYTVSHDLKAPLVTINGFLGYLEKDFTSGNKERFKSDKQRIQSAIDRMQKLLGELLSLSRIGRLSNPSEAILFNDLVQEALDIVQGRLKERGVTIRIQPNLPVIYGDKPRLVEVMQNLIDNAAKYMGNQEEPVIEIGFYAYDESAKPILYVRDNGMGIPPDQHERIFGLFNKLDSNSDGTGVGLAIVKRIIEIHRGKVWVESELGKGCTFLFTLPIKPEV